MSQEVLYEEEVLLALATVSLFKNTPLASDNPKVNSSHPRLDGTSARQCYRLFSSLIDYEQLFFKRYTCDRILEADRRLTLEEEGRTIRRIIVSYIIQQPDIRKLVTIYNEDRGSFKVPIRIEDMTLILQRLGCFERFLRRSYGFDVAVTMAKRKSIQRIRAVFENRFPNGRLSPSSVYRDTEVYAEHNGVRARCYPNVMTDMCRELYDPVSSSSTCKFSQYTTLQAMSIGLAALAKINFASADEELHHLESEDLDEIIDLGQHFFTDTEIVVRQLGVQDPSGGPPVEPQLCELLSKLDGQTELTPFDCRAISSTRKARHWQALKMRRDYNLTVTNLKHAITEFFLSAKMALIVARHTVLALYDGRVRGAFEVTASSDYLTYYPNINIFEAVKIASRNFQGTGVFYMMDECPKQHIIPRPIDWNELSSWPESQQLRYRRSLRRFFEYQERRKCDTGTGGKSRSTEHRIWRRMIAQEADRRRQVSATSAGRFSPADVGCEVSTSESTTKGEIVVTRQRDVLSDAESDDCLPPSSDSSCSSRNSYTSSSVTDDTSNGNYESRPPTVTSDAGASGAGDYAMSNSAVGTCSSRSDRSEAVESIFSDEENRAPLDGVPVLGQASIQRAGEASCKTSTLPQVAGQSKATPAASDLRITQARGRKIRAVESVSTTQCLGEVVAEPVEPEEKRARRDLARLRDNSDP